MSESLLFHKYDMSDAIQFLLNRESSFRYMFEIYEPANARAKELERYKINKDEFVKDYVFDLGVGDLKVPMCFKTLPSNTEQCAKKNFGLFSKGQVSLISLKLPLRDNIFNLFWAIEKIRNKTANKEIFKNVVTKSHSIIDGDFPQEGGSDKSLYDILMKQDPELEKQSFFQILTLNKDGPVPPQEDVFMKDDFWYFFKVNFYEGKDIDIPVVLRINKYLILGYMLQSIKTYFNDDPAMIPRLPFNNSDYKVSKYAFYVKNKEYFPKMLNKMNRMITSGNKLKKDKFIEIQDGLLRHTKNTSTRNIIMSKHFIE